MEAAPGAKSNVCGVPCQPSLQGCVLAASRPAGRTWPRSSPAKGPLSWPRVSPFHPSRHKIRTAAADKSSAPDEVFRMPLRTKGTPSQLCSPFGSLLPCGGTSWPRGAHRSPHGLLLQKKFTCALVCSEILLRL